MVEMRARVRHELKTWPEFFEQTYNGAKRFELRRNDRDFQVGDELLLKEWDPKAEFGSEGTPVGYTGQEVLVRVDYIMYPPSLGEMALSPDYVIMSVSLVR